MPWKREKRVIFTNCWNWGTPPLNNCLFVCVCERERDLESGVVMFAQQYLFEGGGTMNNLKLALKKEQLGMLIHCREMSAWRTKVNKSYDNLIHNRRCFENFKITFRSGAKSVKQIGLIIIWMTYNSFNIMVFFI